MNILQDSDRFGADRGRETDNAGAQAGRHVARHQMFAEFGHVEKAAHVFGPLPYAQRDPPLLEARAEILSSIYRIENGDPAFRIAGICGFCVIAFFTKNNQAWDCLREKGGNFLFQKDISLGYRAAIFFPFDIKSASLDIRQAVVDEFDGLHQN